MAKVKTFVVQLEGYCGPCIYGDPQLAAQEVESLLVTEGDPVVGDKITITVGEMDEAEFKALPEFAGY